MRKSVPELLEAGRILEGSYGSPAYSGFYGAFFIIGPTGAKLAVICSGAAYPDSNGWEHVSISTTYRTPTWQEMCFIKDLCWDEEETVLQFHPKKSQYVNFHPHCLHLWKKVGDDHKLPPGILIGPVFKKEST